MHYRQRIRDAVAARLLAANTLAAANVFTSRARPVLEILQKQQKVLSVYTGDESSAQNNDGHHLVRTLTVSIEGMAGGGDDLDDILDAMAEQVEAVIDADTTLANLLSEELELQSTTSEIVARGNQQVGAFRMDYTCAYITEPAVNPDDALWPEHPLPTEITTTLVPGADAYEGIGVYGMRAFETPPNPCEGTGSCDIPAWQGDQP